MFRTSANPSQAHAPVNAGDVSAHMEVNEISIDDFVTAEPTPKHESRRGWRRRRVRRGKS
ncbi:MAG: hypothetical protein AAFV59_11555 [Pseudomonadota bacterium]